jgi:hypothetical protein
LSRVILKFLMMNIVFLTGPSRVCQQSSEDDAAGRRLAILPRDPLRAPSNELIMGNRER